MLLSSETDGQWGMWGSYGPCSVACDIRSRHRYRQCDSPAPSFGGKPCNGSDTQTEPCDSGVPCGKYDSDF